MTFEFAKSPFFAHFHKITKIIPLDSELNVHFEKIQGNFHKILEGFDLSEKKKEKINFQRLFF